MILEQCLSAHYGGPAGSHSNQALAYKNEGERPDIGPRCPNLFPAIYAGPIG